MTLDASGRGPEDPARFQALFTAARSEDRTESEQSPERLRRRHRDLTARDVFGAPQAAEAGQRLTVCAAACEDYAERVFAALHETPEDDAR
ncbi:Chromate resistance protein ChrB [Streptomyces sp. NPDC021562]|uniref:Chromate resistance protein ChrB n=1 Tax=Streptomyces sp. NPDC021562 TaxID=3155121 RepID=UPI0010D2F853